MAKQGISLRISDKARESLADNFSGPNTGANYVLDSFPTLYRATLRELKGMFTRAELMLLIDCMNATMLTPGLCDEVVANAIDGMALDALDEKWEVSRAELTAKLTAMTAFQVAALNIWTNAAWYGGGDDRPERSLDDYIKQLI